MPAVCRSGLGFECKRRPTFRLDSQGGAASIVIRALNNDSDDINTIISSNVTLDRRRVTTRIYTNLTVTAI